MSVGPDEGIAQQAVEAVRAGEGPRLPALLTPRRAQEGRAGGPRRGSGRRWGRREHSSGMKMPGTGVA